MSSRKLAQMKLENHISPNEARREGRAGRGEAFAEELRERVSFSKEKRDRIANSLVTPICKCGHTLKEHCQGECFVVITARGDFCRCRHYVTERKKG